MKVRVIDDLGRVVIPKEIRNVVFGTQLCSGKKVEIYVNNYSSEIVIREHKEKTKEGEEKDSRMEE